MPKVYREQPPKGPLQVALERKPDDLKKHFKAQQFVSVGSTAFTRDGVDFQVTHPRYDAAGYFECFVEAERDGVPLPVDNPYRFVNPPLLVPDGTWRQEDHGGEILDVPNMKEDLTEVLQTMVSEAVFRVAERAGWQR